MGRRASHRRLRLAFLPAALLLWAPGCASVPAPTPAGRTGIAERLEAALQRRARDDFLATFAPDADDQAVATSWYTVLSAGDATVADAGDRRLRFTYRLPGDRGPATEELRYEPASGTDRIGFVHAVGDALPVWALAGVSVADSDSGTLLSTLDATARERWVRRIDRAATNVRAAGVADDWSGGLVVAIPPEGRFGAVSGESATDASAVTTCTAGTPRIVVNPAILDQPDEWLDSTLVHEAVHVATNSACTPGGLGWAVEGLAESVAARSDADTASRNRGLVRAFVREHGVPDTLPEDVSSLTDYALAQVAVDALRARLGTEAAAFLRQALDDPDGLGADQLAAATRWYVAEVRRLAG
nr:hypothetical protein [Propionicimonas sp.]